MMRCRKMKRRQRGHLGSKESKRDTARWRDDVGRRRGEREKTTLLGLTRILLGKKIKKINAIDSTSTNGL
jgi:hypothetical protein